MTRSILLGDTLVEIAANNMEKGIQGEIGALSTGSPSMGAAHGPLDPGDARIFISCLCITLC
jgi:hypothetical protein